jgi:hypothetical protein
MSIQNDTYGSHQKAYIKMDRHLGDSLVCLNLIYSYHVKNNVGVRVFGSGTVKDLFDLFDFGGMTFGGGWSDSVEPEICINEFLSRGANPESTFLRNRHMRFDKKLGFDPKWIVLPKCRIKRFGCNHNVYFQFDSRSPRNHGKKPLTPTECRMILSQRSTRNPIAIGGKDTRIYLGGYMYHLGDLFGISKKLLGCRKFIGVDSGMSHLAGTLGVKSEIINMHNIRSVERELMDFYREMYPSTVSFRRQDLLSKLI